MTIMDKTSEHGGTFSPAFSGTAHGTFSPNFSPLSATGNNFLFPVQDQDSLSEGARVLEKAIRDINSHSTNADIVRRKEIESLDRGLAELKSYKYVEATLTFEAMLACSSDPAIQSCAHLGTAIACIYDDKRSDALSHLTRVAALEIIEDQYIFYELISLSLESQNFEAAAKYYEILSNLPEDRKSVPCMESLAQKYINQLYRYITVAAAFDSRPFDDGYPIIRVLKNICSSENKSHELLGKYDLLLGLFKLKYTAISSIEPMIDDESFVKPSETPTRVLIQSGIDHFVAVLENGSLTNGNSLISLELLSSLFYHFPMQFEATIENGKSFVSIIRFLYNVSPEKVNGTWICRLANVLGNVTSCTGRASTTAPNRLLAKIYFLSLWKDNENIEAIEQLAIQFRALASSGEDNRRYLVAAQNCEHYKNFLVGDLSAGSTIASFSSLAKTFPYDFGTTSTNELICEACSLLEIDTDSRDIQEIFNEWQIGTTILCQFPEKGSFKELLEELNVHIPVEIEEGHFVGGASSLGSPSFGNTSPMHDPIYSDSLLGNLSIVGRQIDYLPELFSTLEEGQKEVVIGLYNDIIKIYLDWRNTETFRYHYFRNVEETNGQTPVLSLDWNTTEVLIRNISQYLERNTEGEKQKWCYSVIYHIFSNFVTFDPLENITRVPPWLSSLELRDEKLYFIVACSVASEANDMEGCEPEQAVDVASKVLQSHTLSLYYLQNLFLNSLSNHLEDFLNPEFKLFNEDKYLTFSLAKHGYRIGINPFTVHYSPKGWPVSVSRDEHFVGQKFLTMIGKLEEDLPINEHGQYWLTTNQSYHFCEHLSEKGLEIKLEDDRRISFTIIPDQSYHKIVPEALPPDDIDPTEEAGAPDDRQNPQNEPQEQDPLINDRVPVRRDNEQRTATSTSKDLVSKRTLILEILDKIKPTDSDDFISLMSICGVKHLSLVHQKLSERQASIDAQYKTTINCGLSEALKTPHDENLVFPTYLHFDGVFEFKQYQLDSLQKLLKLRSKGVPGGILALEMGLGKTALMAEYCMHVMKSQIAPSLLFCPKSIVKQTINKLREYFIIGQLNQLLYHMDRLHDSLQDGEVTRTYLKRLGVIEQYLNHLASTCDKLNLNALKTSAEQLLLRVESEYKENRITRRWSPLITDNDTKRFIPKNINEFLNGHVENNDNCHLLGIHPLLDIVEMDGCVTHAINRTNMIVVTNTDKVKSVLEKSLGIEKVSWGTVFYDEAQTLHNTKKQAFLAAKRLKEILQKNRVNTSFILSTGTPYQNYDGDLFTLLNLLDPCKEYEAENTEFFRLDRLQNLFETKRHETLQQLFKCLKHAKANGGFRVSRRSYTKFRDSFLHLIGLSESLKVIINELAVVTKRDDVRDQWDGNIPQVVTTEKELGFEGGAFAEQKRILTNLNNDFKRRFGKTVTNIENLRDTVDSSEKASRHPGKSFFGFVANVSRVMIHPAFHGSKKADRETLAKNLSNSRVYTTEQVRGWVNQSIVLNSLFFSGSFEDELAGGCVIFVDEIAPGMAIESCIKRLHPEAKVSFLYGETSQNDREAMIKQFEEDNPNGEQRVLIILKQSGATGTDLRKNGKTVHFCYFDFNPGNIEQAKSRVVRANSEKKRVNIYFHYIEYLFFSLCVQRHRARKTCMEEYFFELQSTNPLELEEKASKLLRSLLLELSPNLINKTTKEDRISLRDALIGFIRENTEQIKRSIDRINPLKSERMQEVVSKLMVEVEDGEILPTHPMTPQHLHQIQPWSNPSERSPMMTPRSTPYSGSPSRSFSPRFSPSQGVSMGDPMLNLSPLPQGYRPRSPEYSEISLTRRRDDEGNQQRRLSGAGEKRPHEGDSEQSSNKRQRTGDAHEGGVIHNSQSLTSLLAAADIMPNADAMKSFLINGKLSERMITHSTIQLKLRDANHQVTEENLWHIIPVLRNSMCFGPQGISPGHNLIQAVDFGIKFLGQDKNIVFNGVIPSLKSNPRLPLFARISHTAVGQFDRDLEEWLKSMRPTSPLPRTLDPIIRFLREQQYDVVIYKTVFNPVTNSNAMTKRSLLNLDSPREVIYLIESAVGETSHYDLLMKIPPKQ